MLTDEPPVAVTGAPRTGPGGTWWPTDGGSALHLDAETVAAAGGVESLARRCAVLRRLALPGTWAVRDLVQAPDGLWLVTDAPAGPTLGDLLADGRLPGEAAERAFAEVATTLEALAAARVRGTEPTLDSVVLDADGRARLRDAAVRPAGSSGIEAWTARCTALRATLAAPMPEPAAGPAATMLGRRARPAVPVVPVVPATPDTPGTPPPARGDEPEEIRFGPGVPPQWDVPAPVPDPVTARPRRRHLLVRAGVLVLVAALTGLLWWWLHRPRDLRLEVAGPAPAPIAVGCGGTAELRVTVRTNGAGGELAYRWLRSDGRRTDVLTETLAAGQRTATLLLRWKVQGVGSYAGRARVRILRPGPWLSAPVGFTYRCH